MNGKRWNKIAMALLLVGMVCGSIPGYAFAQFMPPTLNTVVSSGDIHEQYQWALARMEADREVALVSSDSVRFEQYQAALRGIGAVSEPFLVLDVNDSGLRFAQYKAALDRMERDSIAALLDLSGSGKSGLAITVPSFSNADAFEQYLMALAMMEQASQAAVANK